MEANCKHAPVQSGRNQQTEQLQVAGLTRGVESAASVIRHGPLSIVYPSFSKSNITSCENVSSRSTPYSVCLSNDALLDAEGVRLIGGDSWMRLI